MVRVTVVGTAFVVIKPDSKGFESEAENGVLKSVGGIAKKASLLLGASVAGFGVKAIAEFASFEGKMNEVFTLLPGISGQAMDQMTGQVKNFSKEFGVLPDKVVPALYQALSAGVPQDNVFAFLETAQKAAKGGVTDLTTAVDGISSVINAYGTDVVSATQASDLMFTAVRLGKTNFAELSQSIFNVTPTAAALGVKFGDVTAALAAMTLQGVPTSVATTQLRQLFVELSKAGTVTSDTFEKISGKTFKQFVAGGGNVQGALQLLEGEAKKSGLGINDLFGSVEAGAAALALTGKGTDAFSNALKGMEGSAGATDAAFNTMNRGIGPLVAKVKAFAAVLLIDAGDAMAGFAFALADKVGPAFKTAVGDVKRGIELLVNGFNDPKLTGSDNPFFLLGQIISGVADRIGDAIGAVRRSITLLINGFNDPQLTGSSNPFFLLGQIISGVRDTITSNFGTVRSVIGEVLGFLRDTVTGAVGVFLDAWNRFGDRIQVVAAIVATAVGVVLVVAFDLLKVALPPIVDGFRLLIAAIDNPVFQVVAGIIAVSFVPALITMGVQAALSGAQVVFWFLAMKVQAIGSAITVVAQNLLMIGSWIAHAVAATANAIIIAAAWLIALGPIALLVTGVIIAAIIIIKNWDTIREFIGNAVEAVGGFLGRLIDWFADMARKIGEKIGEAIDAVFRFKDRVWDGIQAVIGFFGDLISGVREKVGDMIDFLSGIPDRILSALGDLASLLWDKGRDIVRGLINGIKSMAGAIVNALLDLIPGPLKKFADLLGIGSPSKVFANFGVDIGEGLVQGIKRSESMVTTAAAGLAAAAANVSAGAVQAVGGSSFSGPLVGQLVINAPAGTNATALAGTITAALEDPALLERLRKKLASATDANRRRTA